MSKRMVYFSHYRYYPIYEPAEGGYYYAGCELLYSERMTLTEARKELKARIAEELSNSQYEREDNDYVVPKYATYEEPSRLHGHKTLVVWPRGAEVTTPYIGEGELIVIENERDKGSRVRGWVPYE